MCEIFLKYEICKYYWQESSPKYMGFTQWKNLLINLIWLRFQERIQAISYIDALTLGEPYDPHSIMYCPNNAFSKSGSLTVIYEADSRTRLGQRNGFSGIDIQHLNNLYSPKTTFLIPVTNFTYHKNFFSHFLLKTSYTLSVYAFQMIFTLLSYEEIHS